MSAGWPPLIPASRAPAWIRARDLVLTLLAWTLLAWLLRDAVLLAIDWLQAPIFQLTTRRAPDWDRLWRELRPLAAAAAVLAAWLLAWGAARRRTLRSAFDDRQPGPLDPAREAAALGLDPAELARWRALRVATVRFDDSGRPIGADGDR